MTKTKEDMLTDILNLVGILIKARKKDRYETTEVGDFLDAIGDKADELGTKQRLGGMAYQADISEKGIVSAEIDDDVVDYNSWNIADLNKTNMSELWNFTRKEFNEYQRITSEEKRKKGE